MVTGAESAVLVEAVKSASSTMLHEAVMPAEHAPAVLAGGSGHPVVHGWQSPAGAHLLRRRHSRHRQKFLDSRLKDCGNDGVGTPCLYAGDSRVVSARKSLRS